ncbi:MAG: FecR domain-containing protein [Planctomycetaceae bacterium]|nr:FecR domain-containing protein [Planctomycetaceae bacterium]
MNPTSPSHQLFADYVAGTISADDLQRLEVALTESEALRQEFIGYLNIDAALADVAALSPAELAELEAIEATCDLSPVPVSSWRGQIVALLGAIAALLLVSVTLHQSDSESQPVAQLVETIDARLMTSGNEVWRRDDLTAGAYRLNRGFLHLRFRGGVMVYVEAPARFDAVSDSRLILHSGRLSASVPPEGIGFTVETPEAEVVDFGTEFSVDVGEDASEVHVFDGLVRVSPRGDRTNQPTSIDLRTQQAVRIEKSQSKPLDIEVAHERFVRDFQEPPVPYPSLVLKQNPLAYYRMPIREHGLICFHSDSYHGDVLTEEMDRARPPHAKGLIGGALRVQAESIGRGGYVEVGPSFMMGQLSVVAFVYAEGSGSTRTMLTNLSGNEGNYRLALDENGILNATVWTADGDMVSCRGTQSLALKTWQQVILTADGEELRLFLDGQEIASTDCPLLKIVEQPPIWFGTSPSGEELWDGRLDEVALFDRSLSAEEIRKLYRRAFPK